MLICAFAAACGSTAPRLDKPLTIAIPQNCEDLAQPVPEPEWRKGEHAKAALARTDAALVAANDRLDATRGCQEMQRETFAKGSK